MPQSPETLEFRPATIDDLPSVISLTTELRRRLAGWSSTWWAKSEGADVIHAMWLEHLVANVPGSMHVAARGTEIVGCVGVHQQATQWFIDDTDERAVRAVDHGVSTAPRPAHTFGGSPFDHSASDALAFTTTDGSVVGSPPITAPPVYDPGGTVTVIDLAQGPSLHPLLDTALGLAGARGDVLLCVVCGIDDNPLAIALDAAGFMQTVDVHQLPRRPESE